MRWPTPPPPPHPLHDRWDVAQVINPPLAHPSFRATSRPPEFWQGQVHEQAAYELYMAERLEECIGALEEAIACGSRSDMWPVQMLALAEAEKTARDTGTLLRQGHLTVDYPPTSGEAETDALVKRARAIERALGIDGSEARISLLPEPPEGRTVGGEAGYVALKDAGPKVCLEAMEGVDALLSAFTEEYVRAIVLMQARETPSALAIWGVPAWMAWTDMGRQRLAAAWDSAASMPLDQVEGVLRPGSPSDEGSCADAIRTGARAIDQLAAATGADAVARFVRALGQTSENRAFRRAFGVSMRRFAREWQG